MNKLKVILLISSFVLIGCSTPSLSSSKSENSLVSSEGLNYSKALNYIKSTSFAVEGDVYQIFSEFDNSEIKLQHVTSSFKEGIYALKMDYIYDEFGFSETYENIYYKGENGYTYTKELGIDNKVKEYPICDNLGNYISFDDNYKNPFVNLRYTDFIIDDNKLVLKPKAQEKFLKRLLQWDGQAVKTIFNIENDRFSSVEISTGSFSSSIGFASSYIFKLNFTYDIELLIPDVKAYPTKEEHVVLKNALSNLIDETKDCNYTVVSNVSFGDGIVSTLKYYVTKDVVYSDAVDENGYSYGAKKEGDKMHEFYYDSTTSTINYLDSFMPLEYFYLDYSSFASELFDYSESDKTYLLKDNFLKKIVQHITPYTENLYYSNYGYALSISLNEEKQFKNLCIQYSDSDNMLSGESIIKFDNISKTLLPNYINI